jgi:glycosyltransferase involved in cell wall biosynthesis
MEIAIAYVSMAVLMLYALVGIFIFMGFYLPATQKNTEPVFPFITVIIPFRNEGSNLTGLTESIRQLQYPTERFEIIFVNDHSTDNGPLILQEAGIVNARLVEAEGEGKKSAIITGIHQARGTLIATTDADCCLPAGWLQEIGRYNDHDMILGPVQLAPVKTPLHYFQEMEWAALQSISASAAHWKLPLMNNGANLAYKKNKFEEGALKKQTASGDDIFLLEDFKQKKLKITCLWNDQCIVKTAPANHITTLLQQKIRWASKTKYYKNYWNTALGLLIMLVNILVVFNLVNLLRLHTSSYFSLMVLLSKIFVDIIIMLPYLILVKRPQLIFLTPFFILIYPFYFIYVFILSTRGRFTWKERSYDA